MHLIVVIARNFRKSIISIYNVISLKRTFLRRRRSKKQCEELETVWLIFRLDIIVVMNIEHDHYEFRYRNKVFR